MTLVDISNMDEKVRAWKPDEEELKAILAEMLPIIAELSKAEKRKLRDLEERRAAG